MSMGTLALVFGGLFIGQAPNDVVYQNQRTVRVPVNIAENRRSEFRGLLLFASEDQGRSYNQVASIQPNMNEFVFSVRSDGAYWLKAAALDLQGKQQPENIQQGPPHQKLVIDTVKPQLRLVALRQGDEVTVTWEIQDENPDWSSFRLEYQVKDLPAPIWSNISATAGPTGKAQFKPGSAGTVIVRLMFKDLAENASVAMTEVPGGIVNTAFTQGQSTNPSSGPTLPVISSATPVGKGASNEPLPPPLPPEATKPLPTSSPSSQKAPPPDLRESDPAKPGMPPQPQVSPWVADPPTPGHDTPGKPVATTDTVPTTVTPPTPQRALPPLQYVNQPRVVLEYELNKVGPSGVGKVELWYTTNDGQSWELCADDPRAEGATSGGRHQRAIDLPGDGIYGFHLVVKSRAGLGKPPPRPGDPPQIRFEVDTSVPIAQLFPPVPDTQNPGALLLRWTAKDNNLTETPITLEWSEKRDGPWTPIAANLPNTGKHSWHLPERMPVQAFLRLRVRDLAGNEGIAVTNEPQLIDLSEPEGRLVNVLVIPKR